MWTAVSYADTEDNRMDKELVTGEMARRLHLLPAGIAVLVPVSFIITYSIAVWRKDVEAFLPYLSMTGTNPPESCFMSFTINITAYLLGSCLYLRYMYVKKFARFRHRRGITLNKIAFWMGMMACVGLDLVANFQVSAFPLPHYIGAFIFFFGSIIYFYLQTVVSKRMAECIEAEHLHLIRIWLSVVALLVFIVVVASGIPAQAMSSGSDEKNRVWQPTDKGYLFHVISAAGEWFMVLIQGVLLLTYLPTFRCVAMKGPDIVIDGISEVTINTIMREYTEPQN